MIPVRHKNCGAIVFWYIGEGRGPGGPMLSRDVLKLDGTQPKFGDGIGTCQNCGGWLHGPMPGMLPNIYRSFDEDLEPDFKLETTQ